MRTKVKFCLDGEETGENEGESQGPGVFLSLFIIHIRHRKKKKEKERKREKERKDLDGRATTSLFLPISCDGGNQVCRSARVHPGAAARCCALLPIF